MSAADGRVSELLDRWLASVELHARYLELDHAAYARVQDWPRHQRPTKWVLELARARLLDLKKQLEDRRSKGDTAFAESLELMGFLSTLLGLEHIERFVPLATGKPPAAREAVAVEPAPAEPPARPTRPAATSKSAAAPKPAEPRKSTGDTTAKQKLNVRQKSASTGQATTQAKSVAAAKPKVSEKAVALVIADAVRFLSWGRDWPQLASSISRLADRPPESEILTILRAHRAAIEAQARRPPD